MPTHSTPDAAAAGPAPRRSRIGHVTDVLQEQITAGAWPVGSRIPTEPELTELTGTGRNTVREAVQALVHAGLLERRQGSGTYVRAVNELGVAFGRRVAAARHRDVLEVRRTLEVGAAGLAAERRTSNDVEALRSLLAQRDTARRAGDLAATADADVALHRAIAQASHNAVLAELYEHLLDAVSENVHFNVAHPPPGGDDGHAGLVAAIVAGDADLAASETACFLDDLLRGTPPSARPT